MHPKIGLTFAASLRSILRHDPDVVLVGEIRDHETAENAIQASLTGHLVFSTLHTNDAPSAYTRLVDMGIEPFLVASTIEAVMAQRLVRTLCTKCREAYEPTRDDLPVDFPWDEFRAAGEPLYRNRGCRACRESGFSGRQGIFELCPTTDAVRQLAHDRASSWEIRKAALADGMRTLRQDAWVKVLEGIDDGGRGAARDERRPVVDHERHECDECGIGQDNPSPVSLSESSCLSWFSLHARLCVHRPKHRRPAR